MMVHPPVKVAIIEIPKDIPVSVRAVIQRFNPRYGAIWNPMKKSTTVDKREATSSASMKSGRRSTGNTIGIKVITVMTKHPSELIIMAL